MEAWHDFGVAQVGGSAALAGLLFVSISINLEKILSSPALADRAGIPFILLLAILVNCSLLLVPGQSLNLIGIEILVVGLVVWVTVTYLDFKRVRKIGRMYWRYEPPRILLTQLSALPYLIAGIVLLTGNEAGFYWLVPAVIASFLKSFSDAWVLLIEINR
jgi:modulator of FtsH protease